jgi:hypothetical protein
MAHIIAISYSAADQAAAETIAARLDARRMPTWVAPRDLPAGRDAAVATAAAFDDAQLLIAVVSAHSTSDPGQIAAITHAVSTRQPVLALRIAPVAIAPPLADALRQATIIDAFALSLDEHADRLADLLETAFSHGA